MNQIWELRILKKMKMRERLKISWKNPLKSSREVLCMMLKVGKGDMTIIKSLALIPKQRNIWMFYNSLKEVKKIPFFDGHELWNFCRNEEITHSNVTFST